MAVHPLRPATDRCLGRPLPHQLANQPRACLPAGASMERPLFIPRRCRLKIVSGISTSFPLLSQSGRLITHVLLTRPPLTSAIFQYKYFHMARSVRLACVRHAASVHPEPGSNSSLCIQSFSLRKRICSLLSLTLFVNSSSIVQFSMTLRFPSHQVAISIYHRETGWSRG